MGPANVHLGWENSMGHVHPSESLHVSVHKFSGCLAPSVAEHLPLTQNVPVAQSLVIKQTFPIAHFVVQVPPQSTSVSAPFFELSSQVGLSPPQFWFCVVSVFTHLLGHSQPPTYWHNSVQVLAVPDPVLTHRFDEHVNEAHSPFAVQADPAAFPTHTSAVQIALRQSAASLHDLVASHFLSESMTQSPPQSMSVSEPPFFPSVQVEMPWQVAPDDIVPVLTQLVEHVQPSKSLHVDKQSAMAVFCPSLGAHIRLTQNPLEQSVSTAHFLVRAHLVEQAAPQSISASFGSLAPLAQVSLTPPQVCELRTGPADKQAPAGHVHPSASAHALVQSLSGLFTPLVAEHTLLTQNPEAQSASTVHAFPTAHFGQLPPQSTSVSAPFFD